MPIATSLKPEYRLVKVVAERSVSHRQLGQIWPYSL